MGIRAIVVRPDNPATLFAGTEAGLYRSDDAAESWSKVDLPVDDRQIWAIAIDPSTADIIFVGTCPSDLFKSEDGGESWHKLEGENTNRKKQQKKEEREKKMKNKKKE